MRLSFATKDIVPAHSTFATLPGEHHEGVCTGRLLATMHSPSIMFLFDQEYAPRGLVPGTGGNRDIFFIAGHDDEGLSSLPRVVQRELLSAPGRANAAVGAFSLRLHRLSAYASPKSGPPCI